MKMQYTCTMRFYSAAKTNKIFKKADGTGKYYVKKEVTPAQKSKHRFVLMHADPVF